jgi:DnaJ-class molecular chaperone
MTDGQLLLPFPMPDVPTAEVTCPTCAGRGDVYYLANRPDVIGGKRIPCPGCASKGTVKVPMREGSHPAPGL